MRDQLEVGMDVWSNDGHKLGKVLAKGPDGFTIEKGLFFKSEYLMRYEYIDRFGNGAAVLNLTTELLSNLGPDIVASPSRAYQAKSALERGNERIAQAGANTKGKARAIAERAEKQRWPTDSEELRVPLAEERLEVKRITEEVGRVRVHKEIHTENKHLSVPVMHEEVHVEHIPVEKRSAATAGPLTDFRDNTMSLPLFEERVEVTKRPVVREEVRIVKVARQVNQEIDATVRKETADIQEERLPASAKKIRAA